MPVLSPVPPPPSSGSFFPVVSLTPKFVSNIAATTSPITLSTQRQDWNAQLMQFSVALAKMTRSKGAAVIAALLQAKTTPMLFGPTGKERYPQGDAQLLDPTVTPITIGAAAIAGASSVTIATPLLTRTALKALDYVQIGNNLYAATADVVTDASGNGTLKLFPTLRANAAIGDVLTFNAPQGLFYAVGNMTQWQRDLGDFYTFGFDLVEAF